jgi:hypothetical protein
LGKTTAFSGYYNLLGIRRGSTKDHVLPEENLLTQISESHTGKYSDKWSSYLEIYWQLFAPIRDNDVDVLEIGIQNGGSLEIWAKLFPNSKNLIGFDVHPKCKDLTFADPRIKVFVEDAAEIKAGILVRETSSNLGVVIDDGSHISRDIIRSFLIFFPQLKPGGIYVIEDLHASYWSDWQGGISHPESSMQFLKLLADVVNFDHWGISANRTELFDMIPATIGLLEETIFSEIESVSFTDSVCVIRKRQVNHQGLGFRVGSGTEALVFDGVKDSVGVKNTAPDQNSNPFAIAQELSPMQHQSHKTQNQELQTQNQELQTQISHLEKFITEIQATLSWRITKPLRDIRSKWRRGN